MHIMRNSTRATVHSITSMNLCFVLMLPEIQNSIHLLHITITQSNSFSYMRTPVAEEEARVRSPCEGRKEDEGLKAEAEAAIAAIIATRSIVGRPSSNE